MPGIATVPSPKTELVQFRAEREWVQRAIAAADRLQLPLSAYIRMVVTQRMDEDKVPEVPPPKRPKRG